MVTRSVSEVLQSAPRLRVGLPSRGTSALAGESMGETPMPLSNTPSHNPLKQRAVTLRVQYFPRLSFVDQGVAANGWYRFFVWQCEDWNMVCHQLGGRVLQTIQIMLIDNG